MKKTEAVMGEILRVKIIETGKHHVTAVVIPNFWNGHVAKGTQLIGRCLRSIPLIGRWMNRSDVGVLFVIGWSLISVSVLSALLKKFR